MIINSIQLDSQEIDRFIKGSAGPSFNFKSIDDFVENGNEEEDFDPNIYCFSDDDDEYEYNIYKQIRATPVCILEYDSNNKMKKITQIDFKSGQCCIKIDDQKNEFNFFKDNEINESSTECSVPFIKNQKTVDFAYTFMSSHDIEALKGFCLENGPDCCSYIMAILEQENAIDIELLCRMSLDPLLIQEAKPRILNNLGQLSDELRHDVYNFFQQNIDDLPPELIPDIENIMHQVQALFQAQENSVSSPRSDEVFQPKTDQFVDSILDHKPKAMSAPVSPPKEHKSNGNNSLLQTFLDTLPITARNRTMRVFKNELEARTKNLHEIIHTQKSEFVSLYYQHQELSKHFQELQEQN